MEKQKRVLDDIKAKGSFCFSPNKWDEYGEAIDQLHKAGSIVTKAEKGSKEMNSEYLYILP